MAGRRAATFTGVALLLAGQVLQASAHHWVQLLTGALLIGLGMAPLLHSTWVECAEIAPPQWRAGFLACSSVGHGVGLWSCLVCKVAVDLAQIKHGWRVVVAVGSWPTLVMLVLIIWLPETPNSLIQRGRLEEGRDVLRIIRGPFYNCNRELLDIWKSAGRPSHVITSKVQIMLENLRELRQRSSLPPLFVNIVLALFMETTGAFIGLGYVLSPLLADIFAFNAELNGVAIVGAAATFGCLVAAAAASRFSPRAIITTGCSAAALSWLVIGMVIRRLAAGPGASAAVMSGLLAMFAVTVAASGGLATMFPVVATENQPLSTRAHAVAIAICLDFFMQAFSTAFKGEMLCRMTNTSFFMAAAGNLFVAVFTLLLLPDTKHIPLELVVQRWAAHWLWRRFYKDSSPGGSLQETPSAQLAAFDAAAGVRSMADAAAAPQRSAAVPPPVAAAAGRAC